MIKQLGVTASMMGRHPILREELLRIYPNAKVYDGPKRLTEDGVIDWLQGCDAAIIGLDIINERVLSSLPKLKIIGKMGVGCDQIDFDAVRRHKVRFGYTPGVNKTSVAEQAIAFMIVGLRHMMPLNVAMRAGERPTQKTGRHLSGRTVGIHGCGNIGKELVRLLQPFNCKLLVNDIVDYADFYRQHNIKPASFDTLLRESEVLTIHLPRSTSTMNLYTAAVLDKLRPDCVLVNTCRGGIVDEEALLARLDSGKLLAACFDVFAIEPAINDKLLRHPNMFATPHIGGSASEAQIAMGRAAIRGLTENALLEEGQYF